MRPRAAAATAVGRTLAVCAATALLAAGCSSSGDDPAGSDPSSTASSSGAAEEILDYSDQNGGSGVLITRPADVSRLEGAPDDFTAFIQQVLADADQECAEVVDDKDAGVVTVQAVRTGEQGVAVGSIGGCGGATALWAVVDGAWEQVDATQDIRTCQELERYDVPGDFVGGKCYDRADGKTRDYP